MSKESEEFDKDFWNAVKKKKDLEKEND